MLYWRKLAFHFRFCSTVRARNASSRMFHLFANENYYCSNTVIKVKWKKSENKRTSVVLLLAGGITTARVALVTVAWILLHYAHLGWQTSDVSASSAILYFSRNEQKKNELFLKTLIRKKFSKNIWSAKFQKISFNDRLLCLFQTSKTWIFQNLKCKSSFTEPLDNFYLLVTGAKKKESSKFEWNQSGRIIITSQYTYSIRNRTVL